MLAKIYGAMNMRWIITAFPGLLLGGSVADVARLKMGYSTFKYREEANPILSLRTFHKREVSILDGTLHADDLRSFCVAQSRSSEETQSFGLKKRKLQNL